MKSRKNSNGRIWVAMVAALAGVTGLAAYVQFAPANKVPEALQKQEQPATPRKTPAPRTQHLAVVLPRVDGEDVVFDRVELDGPASDDPHRLAFQQFLALSKIAPPEARLLSVDVADGNAVLSFNAAFRAGYGSMEESMLLRGLLRTAGLFEDLATLEILVDGEPVGSLGHLEIPARVPVVREDAPAENLPLEGPEPPSH